jgi:curli biogenesis system outer membrane secretion channel CsgG
VILGLVLVGLGVPASGFAQQDKPRMAVLGFQNNSMFSWWGDNLGLAATDELVTQLVGSGAFTVIERQQVDAILAEQHFGLSGAVDASTAAEIGKILGVQALLLGSITQFSLDRKSGGIGPLRASYTEAESVIDARLVNTTTAEIMLVAEGDGKRRMGGMGWESFDFEREFDAGLAQEALRPAVEKVVEQIVAQQSAVAALEPVAPAATIVGAPGEGSVYIDRGENYGVQVGQRFNVHRVVDEIRDASGNILDQITEKVGVIEVTRVLSQSSICRIVEGDAREGDTVTGG